MLFIRIGIGVGQREMRRRRRRRRWPWVEGLRGWVEGGTLRGR